MAQGHIDQCGLERTRALKYEESIIVKERHTRKNSRGNDRACWVVMGGIAEVGVTVTGI